MKTSHVLLSALALTAASCTVDNGVSIELFAICAPPDTCVFEAKCGAVALGNPAVDLALTSSLDLFVEVRNQVPGNADPTAGRTNSNDAYVQEIAVEYAGVAVPGFSYRVQQVVPAAGSTVIKVVPISSVRAAAIQTAIGANRRSIIAKVKLKGVYAGGSEFETAAWEIPISVCSGCNDIGVGCPAGQNLTNVCPQQGQSPATPTCQ